MVARLVAHEERQLAARALHCRLAAWEDLVLAVVAAALAGFPPAALCASATSCISGAMREDEFLQAFEDAGFHGVELVVYSDEPWQTIEGIEFRSVTVQAYKGKQGLCWDCNQAVAYKGPYKSVSDDDGHTYPRGVRVAVCEKTFGLLKSGPYAEHFVFIEPVTPVALEDAPPFDCSPPAPVGAGGVAPAVAARHPRQSKGVDYDATIQACEPGCC